MHNHFVRRGIALSALVAERMTEVDGHDSPLALAGEEYGQHRREQLYGNLESDLDWHVEQLMRCELLSEVHVRLLCSKVGLLHAPPAKNRNVSTETSIWAA